MTGYLLLTILLRCAVQLTSLTSAQVTGRDCLLKDIPLQKDFNISKFLGTWYVLERSQVLSTPSDQKLRGGSFHFHMNKNGNVTSQYRARWGKECTDPVYGQMDKQDGSKLWFDYYTWSTNSFLTGPFWVVTTRYYDYAVVYGCHKIQDGRCAPDSNVVYILSRYRTFSNRYHLIHRLHGVVKHRLCIDPNTLVKTVQDPCPIIEPKHLKKHYRKLKGYMSDHHEVAAPGGDSCKVENFKLQEFFDFAKYRGLWFTIAHTKEDIQHNNMVQGIWKSDDGMIRFIKKASQNNVCEAPSFDSAVRRNSDADMYVSFGSYVDRKDFNTLAFSKYKIVYTDYLTAVVYYCALEGPDGICSPGQGHVEVLSRYRDVDDDDLQELAMMSTEVCMKPADLTFTIHDRNCLLSPTPAPATTDLPPTPIPATTQPPVVEPVVSGDEDTTGSGERDPITISPMTTPVDSGSGEGGSGDNIVDITPEPSSGSEIVPGPDASGEVTDAPVGPPGSGEPTSEPTGPPGSGEATTDSIGPPGSGEATTDGPPGSGEATTDGPPGSGEVVKIGPPGSGEPPAELVSGSSGGEALVKENSLSNENENVIKACPLLKCPDGPCLYGSFVNEAGCDTCECKRPVEPKLACGLLACDPCQYGNYRNKKGCLTCMCKPEPVKGSGPDGTIVDSGESSGEIESNLVPDTSLIVMSKNKNTILPSP